MVGGINSYADDYGGNDELSEETRWIYKTFRVGSLVSFSSDEIQAAIWKLENELNSNVGNSASLIALAQTAVAGGATGDGVKVLNLFFRDGTRAQDQLTYQAVPEPASILMLGAGLVGLIARRRAASALATQVA